MSLSFDRPNPSERPEPRTVPSCLRQACEQRLSTGPVAFDKADAAVLEVQPDAATAGAHVRRRVLGLPSRRAGRCSASRRTTEPCAIGRSPQGRSVPPLHMNSNDALRTFIPHGRSLQLRPSELPDRLRILLQTLRPARPAEGVRATQRNPIDPTYCDMQLMNFRHETGSGYTVAGARPKAAYALATGPRPSRATATQRSLP